MAKGDWWIDAKLTSQQFIKSLPPTEQAAVDARTGDHRRRHRRGETQGGLAEYFAVADGFVEAIKSMDDKHEFPKDFKMLGPASSISAWDCPRLLPCRRVGR